MLTILNLPIDALRHQRQPVIVIAEAKDGRTFICNTAIGIYDHGIYTRLHPEWTCGVGEAAAVIYEALQDECPNDETAPVGFFTTTPFSEANQIANYAIKALCDQLEGIAQ